MKKILFIITLFFLNCKAQENVNFLEKGKSEMSNYNFEEAIKLFSLGIKANKEKAECYFARGLCYNLLKDYINSISDFTDSEKLGNIDEKLYTLRGYAFSQVGNNLLALNDLNKAIELNPNYYPKNYFNKAALEIKLNKYEEAIKDFTIYANLTEDFLAYYERGKVFLYQKKLEDACNDFEKSIKLGYKDDVILELIKTNCK